MNHKGRVEQNTLKAALFQGPDWIPCRVAIMPATWLRYGEAVEEIVLDHPRLLPNYRPGGFRELKLARNYQQGRWTDIWGTVWENIAEGLDSIPVEEGAPLADWAALDTYQPPDPLTHDDFFGNPIDWGERASQLEKAKSAGRLASGGLHHGFMFMRLFYLRGYSNFMADVGGRDPRLDRLCAMVRDYNVRLVDRWLAAGAEMMSGGDDLGMQTALPISPSAWRHYLKPCYAAIVGPCRDRGIPFFLHSDGHILEIIPDLVECGVTVINPQVRANGLEGIRRVARGTVCVDLDLDRQMFPFGTPAEIRAHIHEAVSTLNTPRGGLMLHAECEPDVPLENIRTIMETLEECGAGPR
ncbi:MAG: hypothetical protein HYY04_15595 [Chloroflexi bacterium]|nr:hypothetical protein [Chloroflexota bacterium]